MSFGFKNRSRAGFLVAAIALITPTWATAQQMSAARVVSPLEETFDQTLHQTFEETLDDGGSVIPDQLSTHPLFADPLRFETARPHPLLSDGLNSDSPLSDPLNPDSPLSDSPLSDRLPNDPSRPPAPIRLDPFLEESGVPLSQLSDITVGQFTDAAAQDPENSYCRHCGLAKTSRFTPRRGDARVCEHCGYDVQGKPALGPDLAFRFGWWGVESDGSPVKVGEFQDLASSPFWDLDGLWTTGARTLDLTISGLDHEANDVRGYYYAGPRLAVNFEYERFLHRLDHVPLAGFDVNGGTPPGPNDKVVVDDLNVGEDYAIRVQQLDASFKGRLTHDLKWKVNLWGMRKSGERQANAMAHCFNVNPPPAGANYTCHVLSQRQSIDWTTMEITPVLEANVGNAVVEYSRTMREFGQNDQFVDRTYTAFDFSPSFGAEGPPFIYGLVPATFTQIDRLKLNAPLNKVNQLYAHLYLGDTENKFRGNHRSFNGLDLRLTNRKFDDVTLTAFAKYDAQKNELPNNLLTAPPFGVNSGPPGTFEPTSLRRPIDYSSGRFGLKGRWRSPAQDWLSLVGGYEFFVLGRKSVDYNTLSGPFTQQDTQTHRIHFGPYMRVSPTLDTFVRYRGGFMHNPLIGVGEADGKFNSNQPEQEHRIEMGGTWSPTPNVLATGLVGIENSWHRSQFANFDEDNYPILFTLWYAPTKRFSVTGGYAFLSNWIDQDITIGFLNNPTETTTWNYDGYNNLCSINANYVRSSRTTWVGGLEWNRGSNAFAVPASPAGADWSALPTFSDVIVETTRINVGVDHQFKPSISSYFRYVHFDYEDLSVDYNSGTTNMFLGGLTMIR